MESKVAVQPTSLAIRPRLYGVKGWLALFLFGLVFVSPIAAAWRLSSTFKNSEVEFPSIAGLTAWATYKSLSWVVLFAIVVWQYWVAIGLQYRFTPSSVLRAKVWLIASPPLVFLIDAMLMKALLNVDFQMASFLGLARSMVTPLIWYLYLERSERVRNTYLSGLNPSWSGPTFRLGG
jgi:Protein of unknown function (DUF2569).